MLCYSNTWSECFMKLMLIYGKRVMTHQHILFAGVKVSFPVRSEFTVNLK